MDDYKYYAFLDVLGCRYYLEKDIQSASLGFKDRLIKSFRVFEQISVADVQYKNVSDSIFISFHSGTSVVDSLSVLRKIYISFLKSGLLLRGGVSFDRHFENQSITYSPALTKAYQLEQKAIYPRILIDVAIIDKASNQGQFGALKKSGLVVRCGDTYQLHFIDRRNWNVVYKSFEKIYKEERASIDGDISLRAKHEWVSFYLNAHRPPNQSGEPYISMWDVL